MDKLDITHAPLFIRSIRGAFKGFSRRQDQVVHCSSRGSDALCYIITGSCQYIFEDGEELFVSAGQILYLAGSAVYKIIVRSASFTYIFCDYFFDTDEPRKSAVFTPERPSEAENLFNRLLLTLKGTSHNAFCRSMSLLYEIYGMLRPEDDRAYLGTSATQRIEAAAETIRRRFQNPGLSITALAEQAKVSEVYFRKLFQVRWGMSPSRYLQYVRLEHAKKLLRYPFLSLEECARQSGFSSHSYFCRILRQEVGTTPSQYRKLT